MSETVRLGDTNWTPWFEYWNTIWLARLTSSWAPDINSRLKPFWAFNGADC